MSNRIVLDLSGAEDATKAGGGDFPPIPKGWYEGVVYEASLEKTGKQAKNPDKPYYKLRVNVTQEGEHYRRVVFDNAMLFTTENAPWMAQKGEQLARVTEVWDGEDRSKVQFPTPEELTGTELEFYATVKRDERAERLAREAAEEQGDDNFEDKPIFRNEISAYRPRGGWPSEDGSGLTGKKASAKGKKKITL